MAFNVPKLLIAVHFLLLQAVLGENDPGDHSNWIKELRRELFDVRQYDKHVRPVSHHSERTTVEMQFSFTRMVINEKDGTLETNGWLGLRWADDMMKWDPSSYGGLRSLKLNSDQLWKPDIVIYNSVRGYDTLPGSHIVVLSDGVIYYIPPLHLVTSCDVDLTNWPFDTQTCHLRFGAWSHDSTEILLGILDNQTEADLKHYTPGESQWLITEAKAGVNSLQFDCCSPPYQDVVFTVRLQRRSSFDAKMALAPALAVWLLVLMTFWMRPQCLERIHVGCVSILIMVLLLLYFRTALPPSGKSIPLVVIFHITLLVLCSVSCAITLINSNIIRRTHPVPGWLFCLVQGRLFGCLLCNTSPKSFVPDFERGLKIVEEPHSESDNIIPSPVKLGVPLGAHDMHGDRHQRGKRTLGDRQSWQLVATFIDRLGFLLYLIVMSVMSLHYLFL